MNRLQSIIGRVSSDTCTQLRGLLHSQEIKLRSKELCSRGMKPVLRGFVKQSRARVISSANESVDQCSPSLSRSPRAKRSVATRRSSPPQSKTTEAKTGRATRSGKAGLPEDEVWRDRLRRRYSRRSAPLTGEHLVRHSPAKTYEERGGKEITSVKYRAGWDSTFSAPKSVSLPALVGDDEQVREAYRASVRVALGELERSTNARVEGAHVPEPTGKRPPRTSSTTRRG